MGWHRLKRGHECRKPTGQPLFRKVRTGDEWECRRCGQVWALQVISHPAKPWHYVFNWRPK